MFDATGTDPRNNLPSSGFADEICTTEMNWFDTVVYPGWINRYDHAVHAVIFGANYRF